MKLAHQTARLRPLSLQTQHATAHAAAAQAHADELDAVKRFYKEKLAVADQEKLILATRLVEAERLLEEEKKRSEIVSIFASRLYRSR